VRVCRSCDDEKTLDNFPYVKGGKGSRKSVCQDCNRKKKQREWAAKQKSKEQRNARRRERYANDPKYRAQRKSEEKRDRSKRNSKKQKLRGDLEQIEANRPTDPDLPQLRECKKCECEFKMHLFATRKHNGEDVPLWVCLECHGKRQRFYQRKYVAKHRKEHNESSAKSKKNLYATNEQYRENAKKTSREAYRANCEKAKKNAKRRYNVKCIEKIEKEIADLVEGRSYSKEIAKLAEKKGVYEERLAAMA